METKEAIDILIANAVCYCSDLYCDDHCPFYGKEQDECGHCVSDYDNRITEAVKTIIKENNNAI